MTLSVQCSKLSEYLGLVSLKLGPVYCTVIATFKHIRNCNCSLLVFTDQKLKFFSYKSHVAFNDEETAARAESTKYENVHTNVSVEIN